MVTHEDVFSAMKTADLAASDLKVDMPLVSQGFDSLDMATLMLALESKYKKSIPPEKAARLRSVKDIVEFLNA